MRGMSFTISMLASTALSMSLASVAYPQMSPLCTQSKDGKFSVQLDPKRSVVVHDPATLDTTFASISQSPPDGVAADGSLFAFARTIGKILISANITNTASEREALINSMVRTFRDVEEVNSESNLKMPIMDRPAEAALIPRDLLDPSTEPGLIPLGLFNRFDLAPSDWSYCGEFRIIYGGKSADGPRFLLIFEGIVPNPNAAAGELGCRPVAEF
jgi:hypothetical protein